MYIFYIHKIKSLLGHLDLTNDLNVQNYPKTVNRGLFYYSLFKLDLSDRDFKRGGIVKY